VNKEEKAFTREKQKKIFHSSYFYRT